MKKIIAIVFCLSVLLSQSALSYDGMPRYAKGDVDLAGTAGLTVANKSPKLNMNVGIDGKYFVWDRIGLGLRFDTHTDFDYGVFSFVPKVGYYYDIAADWTIYGTAGVGFAINTSSKAAVDIAIPGVGFTYHINDNMAVGADTNMHVLVFSGTTVFGWSFGPMFHYKF
ncbi:MAG: outer membrane beta-barrel protein [Pseudomonadota bacterium]